MWINNGHLTNNIYFLISNGENIELNMQQLMFPIYGRRPTNKSYFVALAGENIELGMQQSMFHRNANFGKLQILILFTFSDHPNPLFHS